MAEFLETQAISSELLKLIKEAKEKIILVSPYLKVNPQIQERLKTKGRLESLSEIVIIYGKTELKQTELNWIKEVPDIKLFEKINLHAKCYLNEEKAIICSMNLYDFSQQNNIEMGILISRTNDTAAFSALTEEINNLKINATRIKIESYESQNPQKTINLPVAKPKQSEEIKLNQAVDFETKFIMFYLKNWRYRTSKNEGVKVNDILTDEEISYLSQSININYQTLKKILPKNIVNLYGEEILKEFEYINRYTLGQIIEISLQNDVLKYDRVKLKLIKTGEEKWFDTIKELPEINEIIAAKTNNTWLNEYYYLDH